VKYDEKVSQYDGKVSQYFVRHPSTVKIKLNLIKKVLELVDDLLTAADNEDTPCVQAQERHKTKALTMYQVVN